MIYGLPFLWGNVATNIMIKRQHTKPYEYNMRSNKAECSTAEGLYCTRYGIKVPICILEFSRSKIILHHFHVDKNEGESVIGYSIIIIHDLMVQLGLFSSFKHQSLQWDGVTAPMK